MSKIMFFNIPAYGHTNPTLALVKELVNRGHDVIYYSFDLMKEKIELTSATFISCDQYVSDFKIDNERISKDIAYSTKLLVDMTLALDDKIIEDIKQYQPDCIIADSMALWGKLIALKFNIPFISSTTTFAFNKYSSQTMKHGIKDLVELLISLKKVNRYIKKLKNKGYAINNVLDIISNDNDINTIVYTSAYFQPYAKTFSDKYFFVGPSLCYKKINRENHKKTIYISLGTVNNQKLSFYQKCIHELSNTSYNVIISIGNYIDKKTLGAVGNNIIIENNVNQLEVLQTIDCFITHCGMNSVSEALYFKVPLILYPQTSEQETVAKRVYELGAGIFYNQDILSCISTIINTPSYYKNAEKIATSFYQSGGYKEAVNKIENILKNHS